MKIGFLYTRLRPEEKLLLEALRKRKNVEVIKISDSHSVFNLDSVQKVDVLYERSLSFSRGIYISRIFESNGTKVINSSSVAEICGDKYLTSQVLVNAKIKTPRVLMAFTEEMALEAIEILGYPCVMKPVVGSWARLVTKINDRTSAESIIEHKKVLGNYQHSIFYLQEYIDKPGRDIRAFVIDGYTICAIYRTSDHWITNTARGGKASNCPVTDELATICKVTSDAIGGGILAIDLFETETGLVVNEVNHTMEFRNSIDTTGVNIPEKVVDYILKC